MTKAFQGTVAIVTGAGRGIGEAIAQAFGSQGARVALVSHTESELRRVAKSIETAGGQALVCVADVSDATAVAGVFDRVEREWQGADVLVNNAGVFVHAPIVDQTTEDWDRVLAVNARGVFLCGQRFLRSCRYRGSGGSIVNISSISGIRGPQHKFPGFASYIASKFAVVGLTEAFAIEGREFGVRTNCIAPGSVDTEMLRKAAPHLKTQIKPEQIAQTVLQLCDPKVSSHLNAAVIEVFADL